MKTDRWDLIVGLRLYCIVTVLLWPVIYLWIATGASQILSIVILGIATWLVVKFVCFEPRTGLRRTFKLSLAALMVVAGIVVANYGIGAVISIIHQSFGALWFSLGFCTGSGTYLWWIATKRPFTHLNARLTEIKKAWSARGPHQKIRTHIFGVLLILCLILSAGLILLPFPVYSQSTSTQPEKSGQRVGFWTYGAELDRSREGSSMCITNDTLQRMGDARMYLVYGLKESSNRTSLTDRLIRCRDHGVEVQVSVTPVTEGDHFVNLWTFETLRQEIGSVLYFLNTSGLISNPVTTLVYDMEGLPEAHFPLYGFDANITSKLADYYRVRDLFVDFNQEVEANYSLNIRICTDINQGFDVKDADDDVVVLFGLFPYEHATMSYMVYRRDNLGQNYILDHCRYLNEGDTVILNAWKEEGHLCWENVDCAINDARLVLGYPGKTLHLEVWALWYFLKSYGQDGLDTFITVVSSERSSWREISVWNTFPYSFLSDGIFWVITLMDLYGPLLRVFYGAT